jgi:hypothetical protein
LARRVTTLTIWTLVTFATKEIAGNHNTVDISNQNYHECA